VKIEFRRKKDLFCIVKRDDGSAHIVQNRKSLLAFLNGKKIEHETDIKK